MNDLTFTILHLVNDWDTGMFLWINGWHTDYMDNFMEFYTHKFIWLPLYLSLVYVVFRNFQWKATLVWLLVVILLLVINDQLCASVLRHEVARMRPSNLDNPISSFVHVVDGYRGGRYGFPSAHAANSCGLAFYVMYVFRRTLLSITMLLWAMMMCYTRIYLGVHYVGDLFVGMMLGLVNATIIYCLFKRFMPHVVESFRPKDDTAPKLRLPVAVCGASVVTMLILSFFIDPA